jgi:hypothetical protein
MSLSDQPKPSFSSTTVTTATAASSARARLARNSVARSLASLEEHELTVPELVDFFFSTCDGDGHYNSVPFPVLDTM